MKLKGLIFYGFLPFQILCAQAQQLEFSAIFDYELPFSSINLINDLNIEDQHIDIKKANNFLFFTTIEPQFYHTEKLNTKLFSNLKIVENTYINKESYLRGCGPLEDGITNYVNSVDLMLSLVIDNFLNNILFDGRGPFNRLFSSKD